METRELNRIRERLAPFRKNKARFALAAALALIALAANAFAQWAFGTPGAGLLALAVLASTVLFGLLPGIFSAACASLLLGFVFTTGVAARTGVLLVALALGAYLVERRTSAWVRRKIKPKLGIQGHMDGLDNGELSGWALDADNPQEALRVTVLVNKHPVAQVAAVHYRPDVAEIMQCSGQHGFYVDLASYFQKDGETLIDVRLDNGWPLDGAPALLKTPAIEPRTNNPTVLFMHIPKTAGTAFREAIATNFLLSEIAYLYPGPPGFLVTDLRSLPLEQRRAFRVVIGHYQFGMHEALPQAGEYITIVREPAARVLSQYRYLLQTQPELAAGDKGKALGLEELFEKRLTVDFDNAMVRCFSGIDEQEVGPGKLTRDVYELAVRNLKTDFRFVGHQEAAAEAYEWLSSYYGWSAAKSLPSVNRGTVRAEQPGSQLAGVIRRFNQWDYLLYEEIQRVFPRSPVAATGAEAPGPGSAWKL